MLSLRRRVLAAILLIAASVFAAMPLSLAAQSKSANAPVASPTDKLDINTATPDQLKSFPGIGDAYAKRIIDGRPYTAKNQLVSRGIIPQGVYDKIKDSIIASKPKTK
jgi:competence protein ComEA